MRVARLDASGVPDPGADSLYVSDALIRLVMTPVFETGDEFTVKSACGDVCLNFKDQDRFKRVDLTVEICTPDPELSELLSGGTVLTDGAAVGYAAPEVGVAPTPNGASIEVWTKRVDVDGAIDATFPYAWWVLPRTYLRPDARTFENGPLNNVFSGYGIENSNWFDGPANDWPVSSERVYQWIPTDSLPTAQCGYITLAAS